MNTRETRHAITPIAESQRGLVTTRQAASVGVPRLALSRLEAAGDLERVTHGVYRVAGAADDDHTRTYARWLALDPARTASERIADRDHMIAVSHRSAAAIYGIGDLPASVDTFASSYRKQSQRDGVRIHTGELSRSEVRVEHGMLVTTPERTLADLSRTEPDQSHVADALADAIAAHLTNRDVVAAALGEAKTDSLLASRGLDAAGLAASLAASVIATPSIAALQDIPWTTLHGMATAARALKAVSHD